MRVSRSITEGSASQKALAETCTADESLDSNTVCQCPPSVLIASGNHECLQHAGNINLREAVAETAHHQRKTELNDALIQALLCQISAPILLLDDHLRIVFFTPAMALLFNVLPCDSGRPLADLCSRPSTIHLLSDARKTLDSGAISKTHVVVGDGRSFGCVIKQCITTESGQRTVVLVFNETTEECRLNRVLVSTYEQASLRHWSRMEQWSRADQKLRQSAQSIAVIAGQLAATNYDPDCITAGLVKQLGENLEILFGRLGSQPDAHCHDEDIAHSDALDFPIQAIFTALAEDVLPLAAVRKIETRIIASKLHVKSHPASLRRILNNVVFNVLNSLGCERVSLGCRRHTGWVDIELRYTGSGRRDEALRMLPTPDLESPSGVPSGTRSPYFPGLQLQVKTHLGKGTLISISVPLCRDTDSVDSRYAINHYTQGLNKASGEMLLIVEPDERLRNLLSSALGRIGYQIAAASNSTDALECIAHSGIQPDLILSAYSLEQQMTGVGLIQKMRGKFARMIPAVILSAEINERACLFILAEDCTLFRKPVGLDRLISTIGTLLKTTIQAPVESSIKPDRPPLVFLLGSDCLSRTALRQTLEANGYEIQAYNNCETLSDSYSQGRPACLIVDSQLSGISGLALATRLRAEGDELPIIMISNNSTISDVVHAMNVGICDFIEKPFRREDLLTSVAKALLTFKKNEGLRATRKSAVDQIAHLTIRQHQIMAMVLAGHPSKNIALNLGISQRTVEKHRASIMSRTEVKSIPELARLALEASAQAR